MNSAYLIFLDTETTGTPKNWNTPTKEYSKWPAIMQIAWEVYKYDPKETTFISKYHSYVKINSNQISNVSQQAFKIHGISVEKCQEEGQSLSIVLKALKQTILQYMPTIVAHCVDFDISVTSAALHSQKMSDFITGVPNLCTMQAGLTAMHNTTDQFPVLQQIYKKLFSISYVGAHNAIYDCMATREVFFELLENGYITFNKNKQGFFDYSEITKSTLKAHNR